MGRAKEERGKAETRFCPVIDVEEVLPLGKAQKLLAFPSLIRIFDLRSKILPLGKAQKLLAFLSLIRIFAASMMIYACTDMQH